jgi:hypothetical protein
VVVDSDDDGGDAVTVSECVSRVLHRPLENTITLEITSIRDARDIRYESRQTRTGGAGRRPRGGTYPSTA